MILFYNGQIATGAGLLKADVLVEGEKIRAVGQNLPDTGCERIDVSGKILFPGAIDAHTHFDLSVAGTVTADDFYTGTHAAIKGGTTTVIDFATQYHGETLRGAFENWANKVFRGAGCDYSFHMSISDWNDAVKAEIPVMVQNGVTTFKLYMTYPDMMLPDRDLFEVLCALGQHGCLAGVHCENSGMIDALAKRYKNSGKTAVRYHALSRPAAAEAEAVGRISKIAKLAKTPVMIVHLSSREGLLALRDARNNGAQVFAETCPQYLLLDDQVYDGDFFAASKFVCAPPLRKTNDQARLWDALRAGEIQTICTDHCSFTTEQKALGKNDFTKIPGGLPGVETRFVLLYTAGVAQNRLSIGQFVRLLCENPARLYGLYPQKGAILPGSDADIVVFDPEKSFTVSAENQLHNVDYTPYEGFRAQGVIERVYLRGTKVIENGIIVNKCKGAYVKRNLPDTRL